MKYPYRLPVSAAILAMALAIPLPSAAKSQGHGQHRGGGHSSVGDGERSNSGKHGSARGGERRSYRGGDRGSSRGSDSRGSYRGKVHSYRGGDDRSSHGSDSRSRYRGNVRSGERRSYRGGDHGSSHGSGSRGSYRGDVRYRDPRSDQRADQRWRDAGRGERGVRDGRTYYRDGRNYRGDHRPSYSSRTRYRHGGPIYSHRSYYTGHFHRPHFVYRSGFSLGFVIGWAPSYGYRYFDPYCDISFRHLGAYYDHCYDHGHSEVILVVDAYGGYPIATCVYQEGVWIVDDRYDDRY